MAKRIGVLALQGSFEKHSKKVLELGSTPVLIKKREHLAGLSGLIIPGGESSVLLHLCDQAFRQDIKARVLDGLPLLATCAGLIFIANKVENPSQESLNLLPVTVVRNAYGRQVDSCIVPELNWENSNEVLKEIIFIRAPKISSYEKEVLPLMRWRGDPVLVRYKNILAASFHPELSEYSNKIYQLAFNKSDK
jgi:pyridoxal 5'-phosphate synthase pdxT subunit